MYSFASLSIAAVLLFSALGAGTSLKALLANPGRPPRLAECSGLLCAVLLAAASAIFLGALLAADASLAGIASCTSRSSPLPYRIAAFWASEEGSLLFWALGTAAAGVLFQFSSGYRQLSSETRHWHWLFFFSVMAFLSLLLCFWSRPFAPSSTPLADGRGLNPLLRHAGMLFHPPLLLLGCAGLAVPATLSLAQSLSGGQDECCWAEAARPFLLISWCLLTSGIFLGSWWASSMPGWGGFWSWDPAENASLLPWLAATAALHAASMLRRRHKLAVSAAFLTALPLVFAFASTWIIRCGAAQSAHAFSGSGVSLPLLLFTAAAFITAAWAACAKRRHCPRLSGLESREGLLLLAIWILLLLSALILAAAAWPWLRGHGAKALGAAFYNRACLPFFAMLPALLAFCPFLGWSGGIRRKKAFLLAAALMAAALAALWAAGFRLPAANLAAAGSAVFLAAHCLAPCKKILRSRSAAGLAGVHAGLAIAALAIVFSGYGKIEADLSLRPGETERFGPFTITLSEIREGAQEDFHFLEGVLTVRNGRSAAGILRPQRRLYAKWERVPASHAASIPSLSKVFQVSAAGLSADGRLRLHCTLTPWISWLWIGGGMMSLLPLLLPGGPGRRRS